MYYNLHLVIECFKDFMNKEGVKKAFAQDIERHYKNQSITLEEKEKLLTELAGA